MWSDQGSIPDKFFFGTSGFHPFLDTTAHQHRQDNAEDRDDPQNDRQRTTHKHKPVAIRDRHGAVQVHLHLVAQQDSQDAWHQRHLQLAQKPSRDTKAHHRHQGASRHHQHAGKDANQRDVHRQQDEVRQKRCRDQTSDHVGILGKKQWTGGDVQLQQHRRGLGSANTKHQRWPLR